MTFHEKLRRLGQRFNKAEISRQAGLPSQYFSSYLAKPTTLPRADIVFRLARAMNVETEWLLDDNQGWPPAWVNRHVPAPAA